jgi:hypothetical protein
LRETEEDYEFRAGLDYIARDREREREEQEREGERNGHDSLMTFFLQLFLL